MKTVILLSGGLDSSVLASHEAEAGRAVAALSFDYGARHNAREIPAARALADKLGVRFELVDLGFVGRLFDSDLLESGGEVPDGHYTDESMKRTVVPFRNAILLAVATGFAESLGAEAVALAAHAGDHTIYPDCRPRFMEAMGEAMRAGTYAGIRLHCPFLELDKAALVRRGAELGVDFAATWSCYKGRERHCGTCGTCVERREAFQLAGVPDPTFYEA